MAQVSCELVAPKENRPNEGIMFFNIELSPMASPAFEQGRCEIREFPLRQYVQQIVPLFYKIFLSKLRNLIVSISKAAA